jgi:hypothetical protein
VEEKSFARRNRIRKKAEENWKEKNGDMKFSIYEAKNEMKEKSKSIH